MGMVPLAAWPHVPTGAAGFDATVGWMRLLSRLATCKRWLATRAHTDEISLYSTLLRG